MDRRNFIRTTMFSGLACVVGTNSFAEELNYFVVEHSETDTRTMLVLTQEMLSDERFSDYKKYLDNKKCTYSFIEKDSAMCMYDEYEHVEFASLNKIETLKG